MSDDLTDDVTDDVTADVTADLTEGGLAGTQSEREDGGSRRRLLTGLGAAVVGAGAISAGAALPAQAAIDDGRYYTFGPERILDTRTGAGGRISRGTTRTYDELVGAGYTMVCLVTVTRTVGNGHLYIWNGDLASPPGGIPGAVVRWPVSNQTLASTVFFDLGDNGFKISCGGSANAATDVIVDSIGYFTGATLDPVQRRWQEATRRRLRG